MKKLIYLFIFSFIFSIQSVQAQPTTTAAATPSFSSVTWSSKNSSDIVTIQNGTGANILIHITVLKSGPLAGINVKNCGTTGHIDAGSSAICGSNDAANPVSFTSDSPNTPAQGTYEIEIPGAG